MLIRRTAAAPSAAAPLPPVGNPTHRPAPMLYAPRWRWLQRPSAEWDRPLPLDILGVLPPRLSLPWYVPDGLPLWLASLPAAAVLAVLAAADGFLPPDLRIDAPARHPPLRVALFGPGAAAVLDIVRRVFGRVPEDRIGLAFAVRGTVHKDEAALPPGWWPVMCGPLPLAPGGDPPAVAPPHLAPRLSVAVVPPSGYPLEGERHRLATAMAAVTADSACNSPLLPLEARLVTGAQPRLYGRLFLLISALTAAGDDPDDWWPEYVSAAAQGLSHVLHEHCVAFHARVRPLSPHPGLRLAAAILRDRPRTVARTTCSVSGVTADDLRRLADAGWLEVDEPPLRGGRWRVSENLRALPPLDMGVLKRRPDPVAVLLRAPFP